MKIGIIPPMRFFKISELEDSMSPVEIFSLLKLNAWLQNHPEYFIVAKKI